MSRSWEALGEYALQYEEATAAGMELFPAIFFAALVAAVVCISGSHLISGGHQ
jgi:hypothetical protein